MSALSRIIPDHAIHDYDGLLQNNHVVPNYDAPMIDIKGFPQNNRNKPFGNVPFNSQVTTL